MYNNRENFEQMLFKIVADVPLSLVQSLAFQGIFELTWNLFVILEV